MKGNNNMQQAVPERKRDELMHKLSQWYPDADLSNDDAIFGATIRHIKRLDDELEKRKKRDREFIDLIERDPVIGSLLRELYSGKEKNAARLIRKLFGRDLSTLDEKELDEADAYARERVKEQLEREKITALQDKNWEKSMPILMDFCKEVGIRDEAIPAFLDFIFDAGDKIILCKPFDRPMLEMFYKAMHYDSDLADAEQRGRIRGVNERIVLQRKRYADNDVPNPTGMHSAPNRYEREMPGAGRSVLDLGGYQPARRRR